MERSEENGGNVVYTSKEDMERDFASTALHPGDLKATTTKIMLSTLGKINAAVQANAAQASKTLKQMEKKLAKSKKK